MNPHLGSDLPATAIAPSTATDFAGILGEMAPNERVQIVGTQSRRDFSATKRPANLTISTRALKGFEYSPSDQTLVVAAGESFGVISEMLAERGQRLAVDPTCGDMVHSTVGAMVACADEGALVYRFGRLRDLVIGAGFVLADGTLAHAGGRVIKNVAGYDLAKLMVGSLGSIAAITSVAFRLHPMPKRQLELYFKTPFPQALKAATALARQNLEVSAIEYHADELVVLLEGGALSVESSAKRVTEIISESLDKVAAGDFGRAEGVAKIESFRAKRAAPGWTVVKLGARMSSSMYLFEAVKSCRVLELQGWMSSHLGSAIHYIGLPGELEEAEALEVLSDLSRELAAIGLTGQVVRGPREVVSSGIFLGALLGSLETMRSLLISFDPEGRLVSPIRESLFADEVRS